jgi:hypothetical protein
MKAHRDANLFFSEDIKSNCRHRFGTDKNEMISHKKMKKDNANNSLVLKINKLNAQLKQLIQLNFKNNDEQILRLKSDKLQWLVYKLKQSQAMAWYFEPNLSPLHIGRLLKLSTSSLDQSYIKIRHLSDSLKNKSALERVELKSPPPYNIDKNGKSIKVFRQDILPLDTKRVVCVNFGSDHSLFLEAYDAQTGEHVRTVRAFERGITYFPNGCAYGDHFCVSFTAEKVEEEKVEQIGFNR